MVPEPTVLDGDPGGGDRLRERVQKDPPAAFSPDARDRLVLPVQDLIGAAERHALPQVRQVVTPRILAESRRSAPYEHQYGRQCGRPQDFADATRARAPPAHHPAFHAPA